MAKQFVMQVYDKLQHHFLENMSLCHCITFFFCVKEQWGEFTESISGLSILLHDLLVCCFSNIVLSCYDGFIIGLEVR